MMSAMRPSLQLATTLLLTAAALTGSAPAQSPNPVFTADRETCFARVYDKAHLAKHPRQKVTTFHVMRTLGERLEAENWLPNQREEAIKRFREDGETTVSAFVTLRNRKGHLHNSLICDKEAKDGLRCAIECDGGSFRLKRENAKSVLLHNNGFVLEGGCGERTESVFLDPGADDKVFRLDERPLAVCRAEEDRARPIPAGVPLRERFKEDEAFCFSRDYDAAHLKSNSRQQVASVRVGRLDPEAEKKSNDMPLWLDRVQLSVTFTLKSGGAKKTASYFCNPRAANWECTRQVHGERTNACGDRTIHFQRGPGSDVIVLNRHSGLPIDDECETAENTGQFPQNPPTKTDDRTFRLTRMPIAACR
jgi:hypothetical protein